MNANVHRRAGAAAILAAFFTAQAGAMEMKTCADQVILSGRVEAGDYRRIADILSRNPGIKVAVLRNSPGGNADSGYRAGALFREKGIATYVSGYCYSSCSRFFLGGKERFFTDDYPAERTRVGFHSNYKANGEVIPGTPQRLKEFVIKYSDGKADEALVERWVNLQNRRGFAHFFHPRALNRPDGVSILLCQGNEPASEHWTQCEKIAGRDALTLGVATSLEVRRSCDADDLR